MIEWIRAHPKVVKSIKTILIALGIGLTIYLIVSNFRRYADYQNRAKFVLVVVGNGSMGNVSSYMTRENFSITNCPAGSSFPGYIDFTYEIVVARSSGNVLLAVVFWFNLAVILVLTLIDIVIIAYTWLGKKTEVLEKSDIIWLVIDRVLLKIWFLTTISAPTYYISAFDYSQNCLQYHSDNDLTALSLLPMALTFPILGILAVIAQVVSLRFLHGEWKASLSLRETKKGIKQENGTFRALESKRQLCLACCVCQVGISAIYIIVTGLLLVALMLTKQFTRNDAIVIITNLFV